MSEKINDGGPAFPNPNGGDCRTYEDGTTGWQFPATAGMPLRVWFAGRAVTGLCAGTLTPDLIYVLATAAREKGARPETAIADSVADLAFEIADAMLRRSTR